MHEVTALVTVAFSIPVYPVKCCVRDNPHIGSHSSTQSPSQLIHIMSLPLQTNGTLWGKKFFVHPESLQTPLLLSLLFFCPFSPLVPFGISMEMGHLCSDGQCDVLFTLSCSTQPGAQSPFVCPSPILTESTGSRLARA